MDLLEEDRWYLKAAMEQRVHDVLERNQENDRFVNLVDDLMQRDVSGLSDEEIKEEINELNRQCNGEIRELFF